MGFGFDDYRPVHKSSRTLKHNTKQQKSIQVRFGLSFLRGSIEEQVREIASNLIYPRICMQWADVFLNGNLRMKMKFCCFCNACMHVLLAISRTCCHDDVWLMYV